MISTDVIVRGRSGIGRAFALSCREQGAHARAHTLNGWFSLWPLTGSRKRETRDAGLAEAGLAGRGGGWGECFHFMHGRSRMTIDPRIPTWPGRSTSGFRGPGGHGMHQAPRSAVRCSASCTKGDLRPLPRTACQADFGGGREGNEGVG